MATVESSGRVMFPALATQAVDVALTFYRIFRAVEHILSERTKTVEIECASQAIPARGPITPLTRLGVSWSPFSTRHPRRTGGLTWKVEGQCG